MHGGGADGGGGGGNGGGNNGVIMVVGVVTRPLAIFIIPVYGCCLRGTLLYSRRGRGLRATDIGSR